MASKSSIYPICLDLQQRQVVIVGGGSVAERKLNGLRHTGAQIRLVAPSRNEQLPLPPHVVWMRQTYVADVLEGAFLVFAATDDAAVNRQVIADAQKQGILCSSADDPDRGDFTLPATLYRGDLMVAVATHGQSPALAALLRDRLAEQLGEEWSRLTELAGLLRQRLLEKEGHAGRSRALLVEWLAQGIEHRLAGGAWEGAETEAERLLSDAFPSEDHGSKGRL